MPDLTDVEAPAPVRRRRRARAAGAGVVSLAAHGALFLALLISFAAPPPRLPPPAPVAVDLVGPPNLAPGPVAPPKPLPPQATPAPPKPAAAAVVARRSPAPPQKQSLAADDSPALSSMPSLSDAELAGAAVAGGGGGGGGGGQCDMAARVQAALRKDPLARAAVARLPVKAVKIWDGDWIWLPGDDGKGLAAVRQAIMWEVAFAPSECRTRTMHGLVVLSPGEGSPRLALGQGSWRWADLLNPHTPEVAAADD